MIFEGDPWVLFALIALTIPHIIPFIIYAVDKMLAKVDGPRVPEMVLLASTFLFGGIGSFASMKIFKHKTSKTSFKVKFYIIWFLRILILVGLGALLVFYF